MAVEDVDLGRAAAAQERIGRPVTPSDVAEYLAAVGLPVPTEPEPQPEQPVPTPSTEPELTEQPEQAPAPVRPVGPRRRAAGKTA